MLAEAKLRFAFDADVGDFANNIAAAIDKSTRMDKVSALSTVRREAVNGKADWAGLQKQADEPFGNPFGEQFDRNSSSDARSASS